MNSKTLRNDSRKRGKKNLRQKKDKKILKQLNDFDGLWEETEVDEKVTTFSIEKGKKSTLTILLYFLEEIVRSKYHRSYSTVPSGGEMKPIRVFVDNLRFVCRLLVRLKLEREKNISPSSFYG